VSRKTPQTTKPPPRAALGWWWLLVPAALLAYGGFWLMTVEPRGDGGPFPGWKPVAKADRVIDSFGQKANAKDRTALDLLGPEPVFDERPVSEAEADARQADFYLRRPDLRVVTIRRGEPGKKRKKGDPPRDIYTLVTKVQGSTPPLTVRNNKGVVESPSRLFIINPDIVVEVKDGKIHGVRPEVHQD
jgi:hypothetical protein